jgi:hypothetical protein
VPPLARSDRPCIGPRKQLVALHPCRTISAGPTPKYRQPPRQLDWRRIEDNLTQLRPETLKKINQIVVAAGHELEPKAIAAVRGDTFVVETNIHYPTESTLIGDGLRKILPLAAELAAKHDIEGWRQHEHLLKKVRKLVQKIGRASRAKGQGTERLKPGYQKLLTLAQQLLQRARCLLRALKFPAKQLVFTLDQLKKAKPPKTRLGLLMHYVALTEKVCDNARRRVLDGETLTKRGEDFQHFRAAHRAHQAWQAARTDPVWSQRASDRGCGGLCRRLSSCRRRGIGSRPGCAGHETAARAVWQ